MEINEKLELNKQLRKYDGDNQFLLSLQKQLRSKWCEKVTVGNKSYKVLTDKQYEAARLSL